jgi:hypothetical protein
VVVIGLQQCRDALSDRNHSMKFGSSAYPFANGSQRTNAIRFEQGAAAIFASANMSLVLGIEAFQ